jgi:hypothetical protein
VEGTDRKEAHDEAKYRGFTECHELETTEDNQLKVERGRERRRVSQLSLSLSLFFFYFWMADRVKREKSGKKSEDVRIFI